MPVEIRSEGQKIRVGIKCYQNQLMSCCVWRKIVKIPMWINKGKLHIKLIVTRRQMITIIVIRMIRKIIAKIDCFWKLIAVRSPSMFRN